MHEYMIHVQREHVRDWVLDFALPGQRHRSYMFYNSDYGNEEKDISSDFPEKTEVWYSNDENSAKTLALYLSTKLPGRNINIYKLEKVARTPIGDPGISNYTSQGLLPE